MSVTTNRRKSNRPSQKWRKNQFPRPTSLFCDSEQHLQDNTLPTMSSSGNYGTMHYYSPSRAHRVAPLPHQHAHPALWQGPHSRAPPTNPHAHAHHASVPHPGAHYHAHQSHPPSHHSTHHVSHRRYAVPGPQPRVASHKHMMRAVEKPVAPPPATTVAVAVAVPAPAPVAEQKLEPPTDSSTSSAAPAVHHHHHHHHVVSAYHPMPPRPSHPHYTSSKSTWKHPPTTTTTSAKVTTLHTSHETRPVFEAPTLTESAPPPGTADSAPPRAAAAPRIVSVDNSVANNKPAAFKKFIKSPITMCFERMLGAGTLCPYRCS